MNTINSNNPSNPKQKIRSALAGNSLGMEKPKAKSRFNPKTLFSGLVLIMLIIGAGVGLYLTQINQDLRQQASVNTYPTCAGGVSAGDYACAGYGAETCKVCGTDGLFDSAPGQCPSNLQCSGDVLPTGSPGTCRSGFTYQPSVGQCLLNSCRDTDGDGKIVCGYPTGADVCTTDSMGGDYCVDPTTGAAVSCASLGLLRCQCSAGSDTGWWVIGSADSCNDLCGEANVDCSDCNPTPRPTRPPRDPTPTRPPNVTPTPTLPPGVTPTITPTPTTPPAGPQCHNIEMFDVSSGTGVILSDDDDANLIPGQSSVNFVCSANIALLSGYHYEFRIWEPCGSVNHSTPLELVSNTWGISYDIPTAGDFAAQCAVCNDSTGACDFEAFTPSTCS